MSDTRYLLFSGCLIPARLPFLERSSCFVLDRLGIRYERLPDPTCCVEPIGLRSLGYDTWLAATARMLSIAEKREAEILSLCNGCFMSLKEAQHRLKDESVREQVNGILAPTGVRYDGGARVRHFSEIIAETGSSMVRKEVIVPQERFKLAIHPGCHLTRPSRVLQAEDRFEPKMIAAIASWTGASVAHSDDWPQCCGGGLAGVDDRISNAVMEQNVTRFREDGANAILTPCPFCFVQYDIRQKSGMPVLYLAELLALAFGAKPEEIGLKYHKTKLNV